MLFLFADDIGKFPIFPGQGAFASATTPFRRFESLILPWFVLAAATAAIYARLLRGQPDRDDG